MTVSTAPQRIHAFDRLRASLMLLVGVFHAALPYITVPYLVVSLCPWGMNLFFVLAGFFGAMQCERPTSCSTPWPSSNACPR